MKLAGSVQVVYRGSSTNASKRRPEYAHLSLGKLKNDNVYIQIRSARDSIGSRYELTNNIETIFKKFLDEGKLTIRLKKPNVDLAIKGDADKVKFFLRSIICSLKGIVDIGPEPSKLPKVNSKPVTKLELSSRPLNFNEKDLAVSLEILKLNNFQFTQVTGRLLRLQNLRVLDLCNNCLTSLPPNLDLMVNLIELKLSSNKLGVGKDWRWMDSKILQSNLLELQLDSNELLRVPKQVCRFKMLKTLHLQDNKLTVLPDNLGLLTQLRNLLVGKNFLTWLPSCIKFLRLDHLDIYDNPFQFNQENVSHCSLCSEKTLVDIASSWVLYHRLHFSDTDVPRTLIEHLESAHYCICGKPVPPSVAATFVNIQARSVANTVSFTYTTHVPISFHCCSHSCYRKITLRSLPGCRILS